MCTRRWRRSSPVRKPAAHGIFPTSVGRAGVADPLRLARPAGRLSDMTSQPVRRRLPLPDISSRTWEHPADRGALVALRRLRGFDTLLRKLSGLFNERAVRLMFLGSAIRVDERQFPRLHTMLA